MTCPFDITAADNSVRLHAKRQGEATFTVYNRSGRPVRGRAVLVPQNPITTPWLTLAGDLERSFAIAAAEQMRVQVAVPQDAPPGNYTFRLDMIDVENPDEAYCEGQSVTLNVPVGPVRSRPPIAWWIGALVVLLLVGAAAILLWPREVTVPELRGLSVNDAGATLEASSLEMGDVTEGDGEGLAAGLVVASTPGPETQVPRNAMVDLVIAAPPTPTPTFTSTPSPTPTTTPTSAPTDTPTPTPTISPTPTSPPPPPTRTPRPECEITVEMCAAERDLCLAEGTGTAGQCIQLFQRCVALATQCQ